MEKKNCHHCCLPFTPKRNPKQSYCSNLSCQNTRKNTWWKQKQKYDPDYRENKRNAQKNWLKRNPNYWHKYRDVHPEYTVRNRQQQRVRDKKRIKRSPEVENLDLAKSDALDEKGRIKSGTYRLMPCLAKTDALIVQISLIS